MARYGVVAGGKSNGEDAGVERGGSGCVAHGCPLPGVFSDSTTGSGDWRCWAHDRAEDSGQWPFLTQGIKGSRWIFRLAELVSLMPLYDLELNGAAIDAYLVERGREDLRRVPNTGQWPDGVACEPRPHWVQRLRGAAFGSAMQYVLEHWSPAPMRRSRASECALEA